MYPDFSYNNYRKILLKYKSSIVDYTDAIKLNSFTLVRHDVEFDVQRAFEMAKIDCELSIKSSFLFQVRSSAYNIFSVKNLKIIEQIKEMGLHVGLHAYVTHLNYDDWSGLRQELLVQN